MWLTGSIRGVRGLKWRMEEQLKATSRDSWVVTFGCWVEILKGMRAVKTSRDTGLEMEQSDDKLCTGMAGEQLRLHRAAEGKEQRRP